MFRPGKPSPERGQTTTDTTGTGNSVSGAFDRTATTSASAHDRQAGGNGVWSLAATHDNTNSGTTRQWGDEVTGDTHESGGTSGTRQEAQTQTYLDGSGHRAVG